MGHLDAAKLQRIYCRKGHFIAAPKVKPLQTPASAAKIYNTFISHIPSMGDLENSQRRASTGEYRKTLIIDVVIGGEGYVVAILRVILDVFAHGSRAVIVGVTTII